MSEVIATPFGAMNSLPLSPFPVTPVALQIRRSAGFISGEHGTDEFGGREVPVSVLSGVREEERRGVPSGLEEADRSVCFTGEDVAFEPPVEGKRQVRLEELAYVKPASETIVRQVAKEISQEVRDSHALLVKRTHPDEVEEFEMELGFNPDTGAFDAMADQRMMELLRQMGPVVRVRARF